MKRAIWTLVCVMQLGKSGTHPAAPAHLLSWTKAWVPTLPFVCHLFAKYTVYCWLAPCVFNQYCILRLVHQIVSSKPFIWIDHIPLTHHSGFFNGYGVYIYSSWIFISPDFCLVEVISVRTRRLIPGLVLLNPRFRWVNSILGCLNLDFSKRIVYGKSADHLLDVSIFAPILDGSPDLQIIPQLITFADFFQHIPR